MDEEQSTVWASVDAAQVEPLKLAQTIRDNFIPALLKSYPAVQSKVAGRIQEEIDSVNTQIRNFCCGAFDYLYAVGRTT